MKQYLKLIYENPLMQGMLFMLCTGVFMFFCSVTLVSTLEVWDAYRGKGFIVQYIENDRRTWTCVPAENFSLDDTTRTAMFYDQSGIPCGKVYNVFSVELR